MHLARYRGRFGGEGTVVTLDDGRAFTAAHCLASVDGRPDTVIAADDGWQWRVVRRWSPRGADLALLRVADAGRSCRHPPTSVACAVPACACRGGRRIATGDDDRLGRWATMHPGREIVFFGYAGRRYALRRARVTAVSPTRAVAEVLSRAGVRDGDSGGPVLLGGRLVGLVVARAGKALTGQASKEVVVTRIDRALVSRRRQVWPSRR